jgi:hypothetical protein
MNERRDALREQEHHNHRDHYRRNHDLQVLRNARRSNYGVEGKYRVDEDDLEDGVAKALLPFSPRPHALFITFQLVVDFLHRLKEQKQAT